MLKIRSSKKLSLRLSKPVIASALAIGSALNITSIVLANGTAAGTAINNTATATYNDPTDPNNPLTSTSNTVTVEVAEIAGITVVASGINESSGNSDSDSIPEPGETVYVDYTVTNVGNDTTQFRIPNSANVTGPGSVSGNLEVSYDGGLTFTPISGGSLDTVPISPNGNVIVRVPIAINPSAQTGVNIDVQLGKTPGNAQNQPYDPNGGDVYTVDAPNGTNGEVDGDPVNGTREASDTQSITVNNQVETKALVTIEKEITEVDYGEEDPAVLATPLTDNQISYDLSLTVDDTSPVGSSVTPGPLYPTGGISVDGTPSAYILISDAVPANTVLVGTTTAPSGWTPVYTADALASASDDATTLNWYTNINDANVGGASAVTRVGFVNTAAVTSIAPGASVGNFSLTVDVDDAFTGSSLTVGNIAQIFGASTPDTTPTTSGDPNDDPVSDESGDQTPSNYNSTTNSFDPPSDGNLPDTDNPGDPGYGIPDELDPTDPDYDPNLETDSSNNNTGSGPEGEANVVSMSNPTPGGIANGPANAPGAIGPTDNNDDFTNKSTNVPDTTPGTTSNDPGPVNFTNSVQNTGTVAGDITLEPTPPDDPNELPSGTQVTIVGPTGSTATYSWNGTTFSTSDTPIVVSNIQPGEIVNYGVEVDLPSGTPLSTDADATDGGPEDADGIDEPGFPIPITASIETDAGNPGPEGSNITIDRIYTGFLKLLKESRILEGNGPAVASGDEVWSTDEKTPAPGNIIEYRVTYTNISEPASGTNNIILNADNVVVTEDGTGVNGNNWALDNDGDTVLDTSNIVGSATDSRGGAIDFYSGSTGTTSSIDQSGTTANNDVTKYVDTVPGLVAPGESDYFTFQRLVN
ncbi:MAG: hypothetical protein F6K11_30375 [Leptolyngbya sp. SIO3F4]|nr:hypothetical protein [Leptolyngbya sp. SIO3F4]